MNASMLAAKEWEPESAWDERWPGRENEREWVKEKEPERETEREQALGKQQQPESEREQEWEQEP